MPTKPTSLNVFLNTLHLMINFFMSLLCMGLFLDAIASPSTYLPLSVSQSVNHNFGYRIFCACELVFVKPELETEQRRIYDREEESK